MSPGTLHEQLTNCTQTLLVVVDGTSSRMIVLGYGRHIDCVKHSNLTQIIKIQSVNEILLILSLTFARVSVALLISRIFAVSKRLKICLHGGTAFMVVVMLVTAALIFPRCRPTEKAWKPTVPGHCWSSAANNGLAYLNGSKFV